MSKKLNCTIWIYKGRVCIRADFKATEWREKFKNMIPPNHRSWEPEPDRYWTCEPVYLDQVHALCEQYFEVTVISNEAAAPPAPVFSGDPFAVLGSLASDASLKAFYRAVALDVHPDRGGSSAKMSEVNAAWAEIRKARGIK